MKLRVCSVGDVPAGEIRAFEVDGIAVPVLVANIDGEIVAASGMCPHEDVLLVGGSFDGEWITCPGHGYQFELATGACGHTDKMCLPTYRVTIADGDVYVSLV